MNRAVAAVGQEGAVCRAIYRRLRSFAGAVAAADRGGRIGTVRVVGSGAGCRAAAVAAIRRADGRRGAVCRAIYRRLRSFAGAVAAADRGGRIGTVRVVGGGAGCRAAAVAAIRRADGRRGAVCRAIYRRLRSFAGAVAAADRGGRIGTVRVVGSGAGCRAAAVAAIRRAGNHYRCQVRITEVADPVKILIILVRVVAGNLNAELVNAGLRVRAAGTVVEIRQLTAAVVVGVLDGDAVDVNR